MELIEAKDVESTVALSRINQEIFKINLGDNAYSTISTMIGMTQEQIDIFGEFCGTVAGYHMLKSKSESYNNDSQKPWIKKIIQKYFLDDPVKGTVEKVEENISANIVAIITEFLIKGSSRGVFLFANNKANEKEIEQVYQLLYNFTYQNQENADMEKAKMELAKFRNSLAISDKFKRRLVEDIKLGDFTNIGTIHGIQKSEELCHCLAYELFTIYCQKYGRDIDKIQGQLESRRYEEGEMEQLCRYYDYLGFTGSEMRDLIRINANKYDKISRDQSQYIGMGRALIKECECSMPMINMGKIDARCKELMKYDPYRIRRGMNQKLIKSAFGIIKGVYKKNPEMINESVAYALAQYKLEDGTVLELYKDKLKSEGISNNDYDLMVKNTKNIVDKTKEYT